MILYINGLATVNGVRDIQRTVLIEYTTALN